MLTKKAWSPYLAGIVIGLLQIPAFLLIETALGASSSYVTVGGMIASWIDPSVLKIDYVARHVAATGKNWWQVALVVGVAIGAFVSMKLSGAKRAIDFADLASRAGLAVAGETLCGRFRGRLLAAARRTYRRRLHQRSWPIRHGAIGGRLHRRGCCHVRRWYHHRDVAVASHLRGDQSCQSPSPSS